MLKKIAVEGMTLEIVNGLPTPVTGDILINGVASTKCSIDGKGIFQHNLSITISNIKSGTATTPDPTPVNANITATVQYVKAEDKLVLVEGDITAVLNATPIIPPPPPAGTPYPVTFQVQITDPNQDKAEAE